MKTPRKSQYGESRLKRKHYDDLLKKTIIRLAITYISPLVALLIFFEWQYSSLIEQSRREHIKAIAESKSDLLDLFLKERAVNLVNLFDNPEIELTNGKNNLKSILHELRKDSDAFVDLGVLDSCGAQTYYAGPFDYLDEKNYCNEKWYLNLDSSDKRYIITDIYLGLRQKPHFTIGVKSRAVREGLTLRASLEPKRIYEYISKIKTRSDVHIAILNSDGFYQLAAPELGSPLEKSAFELPEDDASGLSKAKIGDKKIDFAFSRLEEANWAVVAADAKQLSLKGGWSYQYNLFGVGLLIIVAMLILIYFRAKNFVRLEYEKDVASSQLEHASKLASVGELAAGVAHEINNPLAIIASEADLIKDKMNPEFNIDWTTKQIYGHLDNVLEAAYRCRDVTRKLLSFVRQDEITLKKIQIVDIMDDLIDGFFERELAVSNIKIIKEFAPDIPEIISDSGQLRQIILNFLTNARDAIIPPGEIAVSAWSDEINIYLSITDSGVGMDEATMEKIFLPFFTTKEAGKGTGLGLSVSATIVKNLGGKIKVESIPGKGSTFTLSLPLQNRNNSH